MSYHGEWVSGNVFIRPHRLNKGEAMDGHKHNFDHTTIVFTGSVRVEATLPDGDVVVRQFTAPSHFLVRAEVTHRIESLEKGTQIWCVYSHRNPQGEIVQDYDGWEESYT